MVDSRSITCHSSALRGAAIRRRNCLFASAGSGGEHAAAIPSLVGTAKLNDIDPDAYLSFVLGRVADHATNRIDELMPWIVSDQLRVRDRLSRCRRRDGTRDTLRASV
ncbi:protein of unknown function (plasmid) [Pararobbsia alpina]